MQLKNELCICSAARKHEAARYVLCQQSYAMVAKGEVDAHEIRLDDAPCKMDTEAETAMQSVWHRLFSSKWV